MQASPVVLGSALVTILAIAVYLYTSVLVARMRARHGIKAPATTGHPEFDRAFRVQMNTLEHLPVVLPLLWLTAIYFSPFPLIAPLLGLLWVIGRGVYIQGYMRAAEKRGPGFGICGIAEVLLLILATVGIVMAALTLA
jgi:glutathione S-transferase